MAEELEIMALGPRDAGVLEHVAEGVFDNPVDPAQAARFLGSDTHLMVVARRAGEVVGMASGVIYLHPDKPPQMWINEVGVADAHRRRGIGRRLVRMLIAQGRARGCGDIWLGTEEDNLPARALYRAAGGREVPGLVVFEWPG